MRCLGQDAMISSPAILRLSGWKGRPPGPGQFSSGLVLSGADQILPAGLLLPVQQVADELVGHQEAPGGQVPAAIRLLRVARPDALVQEGQKPLYGFSLDLNASGTFMYEVGDDENDVGLPERGVYTVQYESYSVTAASGRITFTGTGVAEGEEVTTGFVWTASAVEGTLSLQLSFDNGARRTLEWLGDSAL